MSTTPSPKKKSDFGDFTAAEIKLIMASVLCINGRLDTEKLGKLTKTKRKSACSRFPTIKRKLEKMFEDELDAIGDQDGSNANESSPANSRAKKRRDKVVELKPKAEPDIKIEAESGDGTDTPVKVEAESEENTDSPVKAEVKSGESFDSPVKVDADTDIKVKPEPID